MKSKIIMGSVLGIATIAVAIDHTKHKLPEPVEAQQDIIIIEEDEGEGGSPCGLGNESPCGLGG